VGDDMELTNEALTALDGLSMQEREIAMTILKSGELNDLVELYNIDYEEIPVSIDQFIADPKYLGSLYENGNLVYPFWKEFMHNFFHNNPDKAFEIALSGAIGIGKSTVAAIMMTYIIYKTLCLKNPREFYHLTGNSPIVFVVMNLTLDLAYSGLYTLIVENIKESPWFQERVDIRGKYDYIIEFGNGIQLIAGSNTNHVIGKNVICLDGDTEVLTTDGVFKIKDLVGKKVKVYTRDENGKVSVSGDVDVDITGYTNKLIEIELEDGTVFRCTRNHRLLLKSGEYKEAQYLTEDDELEESAICME